MRACLILLTLVLHLLVSLVPPATSVNVQFIGTDQDWFNASNWDVGVPTDQGTGTHITLRKGPHTLPS